MLIVNKVILKILNIYQRIYHVFLYRSYRDKYDISSAFQFNGKNIEIYGEGKVSLSRGSYCGNHCVFQSALGCSIFVGEDTAIAHNVRIYTKNRRATDIIQGKSVSEVGYDYGNVKIGNNCWIGSNVFIREGVSIGDFVVVGANSVVTRDLSSNSVYAGVPAKLIKTKTN